MNLPIRRLAPLAAALALLASSGARATLSAPEFEFDFYGNGQLLDSNHASLSYTFQGIGLTVTAVTAGGDPVSVTRRTDGLGVNKGLGDVNEIDSLLSLAPADALLLTFNQKVQIDALGFSLWENPVFGLAVDKATVTTGGKSITLTGQNDGGLLVKTFSFGTGLQGSAFLIQAASPITAFRLAGVNVTAVPEPGTGALMAIGLGAAALVARRRRAG